MPVEVIILQLMDAPNPNLGTLLRVLSQELGYGSSIVNSLPLALMESSFNVPGFAQYVNPALNSLSPGAQVPFSSFSTWVDDYLAQGIPINNNIPCNDIPSVIYY